MIILKIYKNLRWRFFTYFSKFILNIKMGKNVRVNHFCKFTRHTIIGNNSHFNGIKISGNGKVVIGDNFHSGVALRLITSNHNYKTGNALPYDNTWIDKDIIIENNVWIGERVIILGGVTLGEGCIIQAGSVVTSNIPPLAIAGGHPAKVFKYRDKIQYENLKKEKKFF